MESPADVSIPGSLGAGPFVADLPPAFEAVVDLLGMFIFIFVS